MSSQELKYMYFNEFGDQVPVSFYEGQVQKHMRGFTRGTKWLYNNREVSFYETNKIITVCPIPDTFHILLLYHKIAYISTNNKCMIYDITGKLHRQILSPGFDLLLDEGIVRSGNCSEISLSLNHNEQSQLFCTMERPVRNGHGSQFAKFYFNKNDLCFEPSKECWDEN